MIVLLALFSMSVLKFNIFVFLSYFLIFSLSFSQDIDYDDIINRIERIERNVSDLQKGKLGEIDKNLPAGYISRNESRLDKIETKNRLNFGILEEIQNKLQSLENKIDLINKDFQARILKIEKQIETNISNGDKNINLNKKKTSTNAELKKKYNLKIKKTKLLSQIKVNH